VRADAGNDETLDEFESRALAWISENRDHAPDDYGAILPEVLLDRGVAWQRRLLAAGWAGIDWPAEHGGRGLTPEHRARFVRACAMSGAPPFLNMVGIVLAGGSILKFGTAAQCARHLHATLRADHIWCQLFSEPGAGSDLASLTTTAEFDGDEFVLNGQKVWCSGGRYSNWGILMARTDPNARRHRGLSFLLLDMTLPGIEVRPLRQMTGDAEFDEVFFDDVRVPAEALLGPLHEGWAVGMATLTNERGSIGTASISLARRTDSMLAAFRSSRDSTSAIDRQAAADLYIRGRVLTLLGARQGAVASTAASLMKLGVTELLFDAANARANLVGADAMLVDSVASRALIGAPGGRIAGGTTQIQRNLIGERLLGLPPEPRP
jgi:alkylation response protein AidB-like acyl-CoA dehydrogenase